MLELHVRAACTDIETSRPGATAARLSKLRMEHRLMLHMPASRRAAIARARRLQCVKPHQGAGSTGKHTAEVDAAHACLKARCICWRAAPVIKDIAQRKRTTQHNSELDSAHAYVEARAHKVS
jgi:hypothetical protein